MSLNPIKCQVGTERVSLSQGKTEIEFRSKTENEEHTIYVENPDFREKPREQENFTMSKQEYKYRTIKPDFVWEYAEITISTEHIQTLAHRLLFRLKLLKLFCLSLSLFLLLILSSFLLSLLLSTFTLAQPQLCRKPVVLRFLPYTLKLVFLSYIYLTPSHTLCRFSPFLTISLLVSYPTYRRTVRPVSIYILSHYLLCMQKTYVYVYVCLFD